MRLLPSALACFAFAAALCSACAAQSFPGRSGHWDATAKSTGQEPMPMAFCLNDDTWKRAVFANKSCTVSPISTTLNSSTYHLDCNVGGMTMKGDTTLRFDGKQHMTSSAKFDMVMQGKPSTVESTVDYHWTSSSCTGNEMNMLAEKREKERQH